MTDFSRNDNKPGIQGDYNVLRVVSHDSFHVVPNKGNVNNEYHDIAFENYATARKVYYIV